MNLPSKELLSEVLDYKVENYSHNGTPITNLAINVDARADNGIRLAKQNINIYELAHKCKEWAWRTENVRLETGRMYGLTTEAHNCRIDVYSGHKFYFNGRYKDFTANTEPEAIFKACEWILKQNKGDKNV